MSCRRQQFASPVSRLFLLTEAAAPPALIAQVPDGVSQLTATEVSSLLQPGGAADLELRQLSGRAQPQVSRGQHQQQPAEQHLGNTASAGDKGGSTTNWESEITLSLGPKKCPNSEIS